jgi:uncharacterized zinc-type alcohol dehydrogenase-like protein
MTRVSAYASQSATTPVAPFTIDRRDAGPRDVTMDILFCGVCHSDIHQARNEWGNSVFPMVPGHEIVGRVTAVGQDVTRFKIGDIAGIGCLVDSCGQCDFCLREQQQFCVRGAAPTYNGTEMDRKTPTFGGYSSSVVVTEKFALKIPEGLDPAGAAPLLCAGITTYSPLRLWNCKPGDRVGVMGLGGLGHMAVKLASSMGAEVTMLSTTRAKEADARRLGATGFELTKDPATFTKLAGHFDLLVDTISAPHDYNAYLGLLRPLGTMILVGAPPEPTPFIAFALIMGSKRLVGSAIGGIAETQEMLDYCGEHKIVSDIEIIPIDQINEAYERITRGDVRYRFVIDMATLPKS